MKKFKSETQKGALALLLMAFLYAIMGIWVRTLGQHFQTFQQVAARSFFGFLIGLIVYRRSLRFKKIFRMSKKDLFLILLRSLSLIVGIGLYTVAIQKTKLTNVSFIFALPSTALLGIIFLGEKLTFKKSFYLFTAFVGAVLVATQDFGTIFNWGLGETLALVSTFFYSFSYVVRIWLSKNLNNKEIAEVGTFFSATYALVLSQVIGNGIGEFLTVSPFMFIVVLFAGATFIFAGFLSSYGFEKVNTILANNIIMMQTVFSLIIGAVLYQEYPAAREIIGGSLIVLSAYFMNKVQAKE